MKQIVKAKLRELGVGDNVQQVIIGDLFGKQVMSEQVEGLIDCKNDEEFEKGITALCSKWERMDSHDHGPLHAFGRWFVQYKKESLKKKMLKETRIKAGLGNPPSYFTTNSSESVNAMLKNKVDYKKSELPEFLEKLRSVIDEQEKELERAIIDRGKYQLCDEYKKLEVKEDKWFMKMSCIQREAHLKRVLSQKVGSKANAPRISSTKVQDSDSNRPTCSRRLFTESSLSSDGITKELSVDVSSFSEAVIIQKSVLDAIWTKANELLNDPKAICMVPGGTEKDRIVKSSSGPRPHVVTAKKNGKYSCDTECPNFKSLGICSHSVATAEDNGDLQDFVNSLSKSKRVPNITKLVTAKMPKGRGRKGCAPPRKHRKKITVRSRKSFADVLKEHVTNQSNEESVSSDTRSDDSHSGQESHTESQHHQSAFGGAIGISGDEESLDLYHSDIQLTSSSTVGAGRYHHDQHGGSVVLTHTSQGTSTKLTVMGGKQESSHVSGLPQMPPPLVHCPNALIPPSSSSFELDFVAGNISICKRCRQKYTKPAIPPMDLCVRHKEWQQFIDSCGTQQNRFGNVYYHCHIPCIRSRCPEFEPSQLEVSCRIAMQLLPVHTEFLVSPFFLH